VRRGKTNLAAVKLFPARAGVIGGTHLSGGLEDRVNFDPEQVIHHVTHFARATGHPWSTWKEF
jgi:hypothetical protein